MQRQHALERIQEQDSWDVIIIGGGATGLGAGVEAVARGYKTLLLEGADFGQATSSRSTKLVHGGVRYLAQMNVPLVYDALHERGRMRRNAPHLVFDQKFIVPAQRWYDLPYYGIGLMLYDLLSGALSFGRSYPMTKEAAMRRIPGLNPAALHGGIQYHDGQFDDARMAITLAATMNDLGGSPVNHMQVTELLKNDSGSITGVIAKDTISGEEYTIKGRSVINATGVFTDSIRKMDDPSAQNILRPSQGVHLVVDKEFAPGDTAILIPKTDDGRVVFIVPWNGKLILGTTDTPVDGPSMDPVPLDEEIEFIIEHAGRYLARKPTYKDIRSVFNGIRPLVADDSGNGSTSALSRDHYLSASSSGLVTIAGGKWTTYRKMAEDVIDKAAQISGLPCEASRTANLPLHGWIAESEVDKADPMHVYGSDAEKIYDLIDIEPELAAPIHERLPYMMAEVVWAVRNEMAQTVYDVLALRTRALLCDAKAAIEAAPAVATVLAKELNKDDEWIADQVAIFTKTAQVNVVTEK